MTLKIEIFGTPDHGPLDQQIEEAMAAVGFYRVSHAGRAILDKHVVGVDAGSGDMTAEVTGLVEADGSIRIDSVKTTETPKRERGKPAAGRARRTKEEIAEDEAADKADGLAQGTQQISTGEERVGPEDDVATQEQDAVDEQAEVEANREPEKPLTIDDVKEAVSGYVKKFGLPATQEDGVSILSDALGTPPEGAPEDDKGNRYWNMTTINKAGQDVIGSAINAWKNAAAAPGRYKAGA